MADADLVRMVARMDADYSALEKQMKKANAIFDQQCRQVETRQSVLSKRLSSGAAKFTGIDKVGTALAGLTVVGIGAGIADLTLKSLDAAKAIGEIAQQAGVSTDKLQTVRYAASQLGGTFGDTDAALIYFNRTFGEFVNTGSGKGAVAFKELGLQAAINSGKVRDTSQAFDFIVQKIRGFSSEAQKAAFASRAFGAESGPKMMGYINATAQAVSDLESKAQSLGIVLSGDTIRSAAEARDKLSTLFKVIEIQGVSAIAHLAPQIADLAQQITDGLPGIVLWVERWAEWFGLIKLSPIDKLRAEISDLSAEMDSIGKGSFWTRPLLFRTSVENLQRGVAAAKLKAAQDKLAAAQNMDYAPGGKPAVFDATYASTFFAKPAPALHVNDIAGQAAAAAAAKQAEELARRQREALAQMGVDQAQADAMLIAAQDNLAVQLLRGQAGYYDAVKKQINDELLAKLGTIQAEEDKQLASLEKLKLAAADYQKYRTQIEATAAAKRKAAEAEAAGKAYEQSPQSVLDQAGIDADKQKRAYADQIANLGLVDGALAAATFYQNALNDATEKHIVLTDQDKAKLLAQAQAVGAAAQAEADAAKISQRSIQVQDDIRQGLEDIGAAGVKGFKSMKDAAQQFLEQLAEMIVRLYVMKPLVEGLLGPAGTNGGGTAGGWLASILGTATGASAGSTGAGTAAGGGWMGGTSTTGQAVASIGGVGADGSSPLSALWVRSVDAVGGATGSGGILGWLGSLFGGGGSSAASGSDWLGGTSATGQAASSGGWFSDLFSWLGFAKGGPVSGPGGTTGDKIPAMLSDKEYVIQASEAQKHRPLLDAINRGTPLRHFARGGSVQRFAQGGLVSRTARPALIPPMREVTRDFPALRMPNMSAFSGVNREVTINAPVSVSQSLAGAVSPEGIAGISRDVAIAVGAQFSKKIRAEFPNLVAKAFRDNL